MFVEKEYNREHALQYAKKWALSRNPLCYNFSGIGGDCTNFVSQCLSYILLTVLLIIWLMITTKFPAFSLLAQGLNHLVY